MTNRPPWERDDAEQQPNSEAEMMEGDSSSDESEVVSDKVRLARRMAAMERGGESDDSESDGDGGDDDDDGYYDDDDDDAEGVAGANDDSADVDDETTKRMELLKSLRELS
jgi:hypothetical protein